MKKYGKHIVAVIMILLMAVTVGFTANVIRRGGAKDLVVLHRVVESVSFDEEGSYLKFEGDDNDYVLYKDETMGIGFLTGIEKGDRVSITVEEDYESFVKAALYAMSDEDGVVFDVAEEIFETNVHMTLLLSIPVFAALLSATLTAIFSKPAPEKKADEFCLCAGAFARGFFYSTLAGGSAGMVGTVVIWIFSTMSLDILALCELLFFIFAALGGLGIYVVHHEKFILKDGVYTYYAPFRRAKSVAISDLSKIHINLKKSPFRVEFFDKEGERVLKINDSGSIFRGGSFGASLGHFKIPRSIVLNGRPVLSSVERMLTDQHAAFGRSAISFEYRKVEYTFDYDGQAFGVSAEGTDRVEFSTFAELCGAECLDGIAPEKIWDMVSDITLKS